jgi:hypothetical protein
MNKKADRQARTIRQGALALMLSVSMNLYAGDEIISLAGNFGSFIELGATVTEVRTLGSDRVEAAVTEPERVASKWHYFSSRGIRVRLCDDDQRVAAINAGVTQATRKYLTEAGLRLGDDLGKAIQIYGDQLAPLPETDDMVWFVREKGGNNQLTFGFSPGGNMRWVALGTLRENGWTCGIQVK